MKCSRLPTERVAIQASSSIPTVLFYANSQVFGGHEQMAIAAHIAMLRTGAPLSIKWLVNPANQKLLERLKQNRIEYFTSENAEVFSFCRSPLQMIEKIYEAGLVLKSVRPSIVLVIQGAVSSCYEAVIASLISRVPYCSYIPLTHPSSEFRQRRFSFLRDRFRAFLYKPICSYITIDNEQGARLKRYNSSAHVRVVENFIAAPKTKESRNSARLTLNLPLDREILAIVGRIDFFQKCQDWVVNNLADETVRRNRLIIFVGDGSDSGSLYQMIKSKGLSHHFRQLPWLDNTELIYAAIDLLLIPSRVEGVPLVMLEALSRRVPVVGTDRDGMRMWLPPSWRYPFGDVTALSKCIDMALYNQTPFEWSSIAQRMSLVTDEHRFGRDFAEALLYFIPCLASPS